jgi:hypothetical protein
VKGGAPGVRADGRPAGAAADEGRVEVESPGVDMNVSSLSPTRSPFVVSNGWRYLRAPRGRFVCRPEAGGAALAAFVAHAFGADVDVEPRPEDREALERARAWLARLPEVELPAVAQIGLLDDGREDTQEVMNLLVRRNLLFRPVKQRDRSLRLHVAIGSPAYPRALARDPSAFALRVRRELGDGRRALRVFGSETVIGRLRSDGKSARVHLVNYGGNRVAGLRVRVQGAHEPAAAWHDAPAGDPALLDLVVEAGFTEVTVRAFDRYAVVDFGPAGRRPGAPPL